jgi:phosphoglycolate phosphatase-like HAD superfamily hydrolase
VRGILFDLDETLIDRRTSLERYARTLRTDYSSTLDEDAFVAAFHRLDGTGRVPRPTFFGALARELFVGIDAAAIETHFYDCAWRAPLLHDAWRR